MQRHVVHFGASVILMAANVLMAARLWSSPYLLTRLYAVLAILVLSRWHTADDLAYFFVALVLGPSAEAVAIAGGAWSYQGAESGFPIWLPLVWGLAGFATRRTTAATLGFVGELREPRRQPARVDE